MLSLEVCGVTLAGFASRNNYAILGIAGHGSDDLLRDRAGHVRRRAFVHNRKQIVYIKRIGTHKEYDKWDL